MNIKNIKRLWIWLAVAFLVLLPSCLELPDGIPNTPEPPTEVPPTEIPVTIPPPTEVSPTEPVPTEPVPTEIPPTLTETSIPATITPEETETPVPTATEVAQTEPDCWNDLHDTYWHVSDGLVYGVGEIVNDTDDPDEDYFHIPAEYGNSLTHTGIGGIIFCAKIEIAAEYQIAIDAVSFSNSTNSFFYSFNGSEPRRLDVGFNDFNGEVVVSQTMILPVGEYTFDFSHREARTRLKRLYIRPLNIGQPVPTETTAPPPSTPTPDDATGYPNPETATPAPATPDPGPTPEPYS